MKAWKVLVLVVLAAVAGQGNGHAQGYKTAYYADLYSHITDPAATNSSTVVDFVAKLDRQRTRFKSEKDFLRTVFVKTNQRFLKNYTDYASFNDLFGKQGTFNCLTGTALFALVLENLNVPYRIIETNYHIFILAQTSNGEVLLETTDRVNGFVDSSEGIEARIQRYKQGAPVANATSKVYYRYTASIYNEVNLDQLIGLMHYNLSIVAYNNQNLPESISHLGKALDLHPSPRIEEFSRIILFSVSQSNLDAPIKEKYLKNIQVLRKKQMAITASAH